MQIKKMVKSCGKWNLKCNLNKQSNGIQKRKKTDKQDMLVNVWLETGSSK
jgi:hypothetical protein